MNELIKKAMETEVINLSGSGQEEYLSTLIKSLNSVKLDNIYPKKKIVRNFLNFLSRKKHNDICEALEVDAESGFPTRKEVRGISLDEKMADENLSFNFTLEEIKSKIKEKIFSFTTEEAEKLRKEEKKLSYHLKPEQDSYKRLDYFTKIKKSELAEKLRREKKGLTYKFKPEKSVFPVLFDAEFFIRIPVKGKMYPLILILDGFDTTKNLFAKYTIELNYKKKPFISQDIYIPNKKNGGLNPKFANFLKNCFFLTAEDLFHVLSRRKDIEVQSVIRTLIGPIYFPQTKKTNLFTQIDENYETIKDVVNRHNLFCVSFPKEKFKLIRSETLGDVLEMKKSAKYVVFPKIPQELEHIANENYRFYVGR